MRLGSIGLTATLLFAVGCHDLDRFDTGNDEAYCGSIVSGGPFREGFPANLRLRATIDTSNLTTLPGTLTTDDQSCSATPLLHAAPMRATEQLLHDPLSTFDFGTGRDHNFFAWVDSSCQGPMLAVVSLMKNNDVEVRLMKPPTPPATGTGDPDPAWFGVFQLARHHGDCGF
jgi:hypothetical protein